MTVFSCASGVTASSWVNVARWQLAGTSARVVSGMASRSGILSSTPHSTVAFGYEPRVSRAAPPADVPADAPWTSPVSNAAMSLPVRGGTVFGPGTPQPSSVVVPLKIENMWSAPIAMLSIIRVRWKLLPQRVGVFNDSLPYCVMSSRLKFPDSGSSQVSILCPLGPCFRQASPAVKPENSAKGRIEPNPAPTTRAVADAAVLVEVNPSTPAKNVLNVCCGMWTRTRVNDESYEMHAVLVAVRTRWFASVQPLQVSVPSGRFSAASVFALASLGVRFGRSCAEPRAAASALLWICRRCCHA